MTGRDNFTEEELNFAVGGESKLSPEELKIQTDKRVRKIEEFMSGEIGLGEGITELDESETNDRVRSQLRSLMENKMNTIQQSVNDSLVAEKDLLEMYIEQVDRLTMEEKLVALAEEPDDSDLTPWDIDGIVLEALGKLGDAIELEQSELIYDVIYEAITEAIHRRE